MKERTISAIAFATGFRDLSHFNRTFRQHFGMTPSDTRHINPVSPTCNHRLALQAPNTTDRLKGRGQQFKQ